MKAIPDVVGFEFGDLVYHKTDPEKAGVVVGINFYPGGHSISVQWATTMTTHYPFEISKEREFSSTP